jgi:CSLREA domain-containing protein
MVNKNQSRFGALLFPLITLVTIVFVFVLYRPSQASPEGSLIVNTVADTDDGTCDVANCTLREAVNTANNTVGANTITFSLPPTATITLAGTQLPIISDTLTFDGSTAVNLSINAADQSRHFEIGSGTAVTITNLTLSFGESSSGGAIYNDGGLLNVGLSTFLANESWDGFGGGGAIANFEGTLNISDSFFRGNVTNGIGGAILNDHGTVNIRNSTFLENAVLYPPVLDGAGGAIANEEGILNISNSTFGGNYCQPHYRQPCFGGGIANFGILVLNNSTLNKNAAYAFGYPVKGGGIYNGAGLQLRNTIIANSEGGDCFSWYFSTNINNLVEDGSCYADFTGDPLLGSLRANGGPTRTYAPLSISLAVDKGDNATCADPPVNNLDQRGVVRPLDGNGDGTPNCDIGSYEYDGPPPDRFFLPLLFRN